MAAKIQYQCQQCSAMVNKWAGQCGDCGSWNALVEVAVESKNKRKTRYHMAGVAARTEQIHTLAEADAHEEIRTPSGLAEFDRVLGGGGLVAGSVVLIGGDPGIGKSTLLLQMQDKLATHSNLRTLYVSGEESDRQVALRARRLGMPVDKLRFLAETNVERILKMACEDAPQVMIIDSIQTLHTDQIGSAPGGVSQVRESAAQLVQFAKQTGTSLFLVGHVTKEGALAGPRVLEHMVDTVLYFEGDSGSRFRVLRAVKNRFGAVNELGVFSMDDKGLREVTNPSAIFLSRHAEDSPGSVIIVTREGTRPLLVELQALVDESQSSHPRRVTVGLEQNRLAMLLAVLHRHGGLVTGDQDVFVNAVGGVRISETGADLGILCSIVSSLRDKPLDMGLIVFGEVGLSGEIRPVQNGPERLKEAAKHGFTKAIVPKGNIPKGGLEGLEIHAVTRLTEVLDLI